VPLFSRFQIEHQIETGVLRAGPAAVGARDRHRSYRGPGGRRRELGTGRPRAATSRPPAFNTNLEAATRLPASCACATWVGLIVIDFHRHGEARRSARGREPACATRCKYDRARVQLGKISRFGLMELSRQRLRPALAESAYIPCPRCHGIGHIRGTESTRCTSCASFRKKQ
jgi:ribonuclease E